MLRYIQDVDMSELRLKAPRNIDVAPSHSTTGVSSRDKVVLLRNYVNQLKTCLCMDGLLTRGESLRVDILCNGVRMRTLRS